MQTKWSVLQQSYDLLESKQSLRKDEAVTTCKTLLQ